MMRFGLDGHVSMSVLFALVCTQFILIYTRDARIYFNIQFKFLSQFGASILLLKVNLIFSIHKIHGRRMISRNICSLFVIIVGKTESE